MRGLKFFGWFKNSQVHAIPHSSEPNNASQPHHRNLRVINLIDTKWNETNSSVSDTNLLLPYGLPSTNLLEPPIEPYLKPINLVESLADVYRRIDQSSQSQRSLLCIEQYSLLCGFCDSKLLHRCLRLARQWAVDIHSKVVISAWLRFERQNDELESTYSVDCSGRVHECPKSALVNGVDPFLVSDHCPCHLSKSDSETGDDIECCDRDDEKLNVDVEGDVLFCIDAEEISCFRDKIAALSTPLNVMLYGYFAESRREKIDFAQNGISANGMRAVEVFSRMRSECLKRFPVHIVLELLGFANRFCCEEMKSACDSYLASIIGSKDDALILMDYGLEETASLLVASCLQVFLREFPGSFNNPIVMKFFCSSDAMERLRGAGHASFLLYYFLSRVAMEVNLISDMTVMLLERLGECATEIWQRALAMHHLGCVKFERKEYKDAQSNFEAAVEAGHVYSIAGVARCKYKQGSVYSAFKLMTDLISDRKPAGWMYQERSLYGVGRMKISDLNTATELDPALQFPHKYRAVSMVEDNQIAAAIAEINRILAFKVSADCLELRAWFFMALENYGCAIRDISALLTLEPNYMMFLGKLRADHLVGHLSHHVSRWSQADCWMQLYDHWSSVDDIGSLAVIHQMLENDPRKSILWFRQSLLLLRLNCQKAAMRCLQLARKHSSSVHERLVYEGWILYDTGHREEAVCRAEESIRIQRSFEAYFLKAYSLADTSLDPETSSLVIQLLEEALRCPSDGLRKGQALNNLGSVYVDCGKLDLAADCYMKALDIKHTRAHQGLARVYHLKNQKTAAYDEMTNLIVKAKNNASAYEKRSEYCEREMAKSDLDMATRLDPLRTYPYRYRAAVLMDDQRETEAVEELTKALAFKPDVQMLHLRAAFHESMGDFDSALQDCEAALCLDPSHMNTLDLYSRARHQASHQQEI
ncbi:Tetratricopeptide repeat [Dillenia turbinata]|uniref:Tetratricopeptide repeat n=1 Tax=Dillenia turbinata TaxID=194707 RepID=A0AAN8VTZ0_9MAGN